MLVRRKTMERLLQDQQRAHQRDRAELVQLIRTQNEQLLFLAGKQWAPTPLDLQLAEAEPVDTSEDEWSMPDPWQLPDDLGDAVWS